MASSDLSLAGGSAQQQQQQQANAGTLAVLYGVGTRLREYGTSSLANRKPWTEALERGSFAKPTNVAEATARLRKNAAYFRTNYAMVMAGSVALGFLMHPSSLFVLAALVIGWVYVFAMRSGPLVVNGRELSEREKLMGMSGLSVVVVFFLTNVASVVFSALVFGAGLVAAHGACRVPDDLFIDDGGDSNQGLLSILTGGGGGQSNAASNV